MDSHKVVSIRKSTDDIIMTHVRDEYLRHHPELQGMKFSRDFLILKTIIHYIPKSVSETLFK